MSASIVAVFNQKGGVGKSNISMELAGALARRQYKVVVIDVDRQGTATKWPTHAQGDLGFPCKVVSLAQMEVNFIGELRHYVSHEDFIIIDCPPAADSPIPSAALSVAHLALIPTMAGIGELEANVDTKRLISLARAHNPNLKAAMVLSAIERTSLARNLVRILRADKVLPTFATEIPRLVAFQEAQAMGTTVHALTGPGARRAVESIEALADEVVTTLGGTASAVKSGSGSTASEGGPSGKPVSPVKLAAEEQEA